MSPEDLARILTLGRVFQRNDLGIDDIGDWQPTMPDCLHELSVVSKGRRLECDFDQPRPNRNDNAPFAARLSCGSGSSVTYRPGMPIEPAARVTSIA